jgi:hypothetical protein
MVSDPREEEPIGSGCGSDFLSVALLGIAVGAYWYGWEGSVPIVIGMLAGSLLVGLFGLLRRYFFAICVLLYIGWIIYGYLTP